MSVSANLRVSIMYNEVGCKKEQVMYMHTDAYSMVGVIVLCCFKCGTLKSHKSKLVKKERKMVAYNV